MIVFPHCKINIGLNITAKRPDGYHNLQSIFYPVPLCDILESVKSDELSIGQSGLPMNVEDQNNLILKAYQLLKQDFDLEPAAIHLHKVIPMGAGLGGGSADGAFMLRLLNDIYDLNLTTKDLERYALQLGSDCPFFIHDYPCLVSGRGEILERIDLDLSHYYIKLVNPGIHISTSDAFSGIKPGKPDFDLSSMTNENFENCVVKLTNDFEKEAIRKHPQIGEIKVKMYNEGAFYASMTGTGSTVYGIYKIEPSKTFSEYIEFISKFIL